MTKITINMRHTMLKRYLPGIVLVTSISLIAVWFGSYPAIRQCGMGTLTLAIISGIVAGHFLYTRPFYTYCEAGVSVAKHALLRLGVILYGFNLTIQQVSAVGLRTLFIDLLILGSTLLLALISGRYLFKLDAKTTWLTGAGSSICGAAAILATASAIKAETGKVTSALSTVVLFGTLATFIYPAFYFWLIKHGWNLSVADYGIYIGSTIHEVAQVVATGHSVGPQAEETAVISRMLRVMMLAPLLLLAGCWFSRHHPSSDSSEPHCANIPLWPCLFIALVLFNSLNWIPVTWIANIRLIDNFLLTMAMAALGLTTQFSTLRTAGWRPILLGLLLFIWLLVAGGAINLLFIHMMS